MLPHHHDQKVGAQCRALNRYFPLSWLKIIMNGIEAALILIVPQCRCRFAKLQESGLSGCDKNRDCQHHGLGFWLAGVEMQLNVKFALDHVDRPNGDHLDAFFARCCDVVASKDQ